jgi:non-specific serine/threonine protein kinase
MDSNENHHTTRSGVGTGLPRAHTSFVGRRRELGEISALLGSSSLVTVTGAAGCGKTRLALEVAGDLSPNYRDGVFWLDLADLIEPSLVSVAVSKAVRVEAQPGRPTLDALVAALQHRCVLVVLDNCEHLLDACREVARMLLVATDARILATSREPLGISGEMRYPLTPLTAPSVRLGTRYAEQSDAVQLFVERARAVLPDFVLSAANAEAVASICRQLDGLPLAIELVSARVNVLSVQQMAARLDDRLELQTPTGRDLSPGHHGTLRSAIDWSFALLSPPERLLLARLAVFAGGWSLTAAEDVCVGEGLERDEILPCLSALVNRSLVVSHTLRPIVARYGLLETIRQYADEKLLALGERPRLRDRHLRYFLQLAEETESRLSGPFQQLWLSRLEDDHPNFRAALGWSLERHHVEAGLRLLVALYQCWTIRDYVEEALAWFDRLLRQPSAEVDPVVRAKALAYAAFLSGFRGKRSEQMRYGREAECLAEAAGEKGKSALVWALEALAHAARAAGEHESAYAMARRIIDLRRGLGDPYYLGLALSVHSPTAMVLGRYAEARAMLDEALPLLRNAGNPYRIAMALNYAGDLARCSENYAQAQVAYEASLQLLRDIGATRDLASVLHNLGLACLHLGTSERAEALFRESMALQQTQQNTPGMAECLIGFAALAISAGVPGAGTRLLSAAETIGGPNIASAWAATRKDYEHYLSRARASLAEREFQLEQSAGHFLSLEQAVAFAQGGLVIRAGPQSRSRTAAELTSREREIAERIGHGKSNGEIADELVMSKRTVEKHIAHILSKLGFSRRAEIVRWALKGDRADAQVR